MKDTRLAEINMSEKSESVSFKKISRIRKRNNRMVKDMASIFRIFIVLKPNLLIRLRVRFLRKLLKFPSEQIVNVSVSLSSS